jgi:hypothetical protein
VAGTSCQCPTCGHIFIAPAASGAAAPPPVPSAFPPPLPPTSGYPSQQPNPFAHDEWSAPSAPQGAVYPPETFHNLFLAYIILGILTFVAAVILGVGAAFAIMSQRDTSFATAGKSQADPFGRPTPQYTSSRSDPPVALIATIVIGVLVVLGLLLANVIAYYMLLYKAWNMIQDGRPRTTPGLAIGLMFVPFFNLYWQFVAIRGLAEDLNFYAQRRNYHIREANVGIVTASLVMGTVSAVLNFCPVPEVGLVVMIISLVGVVLGLVGLYSIKNAAADVASAKMGMI